MRFPRFFSFVAAFAILCMVPAAALALTAEERAALEKQLEQVNAEIAQNQAQLSVKQKERTSLERDVSILNSKIQAAQLGIKQRDLTIRKLNGDVDSLSRGIRQLDSRVAAGQESLAQILRLTQRIDDKSLVEVVLQGSVSDIFQEIDEFETVQRELGNLFEDMALTRTDLASRKEALQEKQQEESDLRQLQVLQQNSLKQSEKDKQDLVKAAKGQEANYQKVIADRQKTAAQIKAALFEFRDSSAMPFGTAYQYAKEASAKTGVRPAVILAVLRQETNLGQNVGSCSYHTAMHPTRDVPVFLTLMAELGLDPEAAKVSCKPSYGWGGAMGPAQFIPSTWVQYKSRLEDLAGQTPPNPWTPRTAVFATAMLMADNGADAGTRSAERLAALRYFAGWGNANKAAYQFYGDDVIEFADSYQQDIDVLEGKH